MDWTKTRRTSYRFLMVDPVNLDLIRGELDGVDDYGSTLEFSYYAELKSSGSLKLVESNYIENSLIRVFMDVEQGNEFKTIELGTFFADPSTMTYEHGRWYGSMPLTGTLLKYQDHLFNNNYASDSKGNVAERLERFIKQSKGTPLFMDNLRSSSKRFGEAIMWEFGSNVREAMQGCADKIGAEIVDDSHGRTVIKKYIEPAKRPVSFSWPYGDESLTMVGVEREENVYDMPNCCIVKMSESDANYFGQSSLSSSHIASAANKGRFIYKSYTESDDNPSTSKANGLAKKHLDESTQFIRTYKVQSFYVPVLIGDVVDFRYVDTDSDEGISARCMVQTIQMTLSPGTKCTYTLKEVSQ